MNYFLDDLAISPTGINIPDVFECWKWLVTDVAEVLVISKMGDVFFTSKEGCVYWLATDTCTLTKISSSRAGFDILLNNIDNIDNWFLPQLLSELEQAGILLNNNQVYSYKKMPVLGGKYTVDNIEPTDIKVHFDLTGIIGEQINDLPDGTKIKINVAD